MQPSIAKNYGVVRVWRGVRSDIGRRPAIAWWGRCECVRWGFVFQIFDAFQY